METILVTGAAGFIGYHVTKRLLKDGYNVIGVDNLNDYYDVNLKYGRLNDLGISREKINFELINDLNVNNFTFYKLDISDNNSVALIFQKFRFDYIIHLAAQAGVRYSLENPRIYLSSNVDGTLNILEGVKLQRPKHFIYASSSSVYGISETFPLSETDETSKPVSLYAATKKTTELLAYTYSHLYDLKTTGLRFFTVYGPWARPDMALSIFADAITNNKPITLFNHGNMLRDFTYVDDIVESIVRVMTKNNSLEKEPSQSDNAIKQSSYNVFNIGNGEPVSLLEFVKALEDAFGKKAIIQYEPLQPGDVLNTHADTQRLTQFINFDPNTELSIGVGRFVEWYNKYHSVYIYY